MTKPLNTLNILTMLMPHTHIQIDTESRLLYTLGVFCFILALNNSLVLLEIIR